MADTTGLTPQSELLRRAAAHVRYLAGDPVEWDMDSHDWVNFEVYEDEPEGWVRKLVARTLGRPTRAMHVAAWDPKVAHLVAAWLEAVAKQEEYTMAEFGYRTAPAEALAAARALVGEGE